MVVVMVLFGGRGKMSKLMGDFAQGIKAFKKGMAEDDKTAETKPEPAKTIDHRPSPQRRRRKPSARRKRALLRYCRGGVRGRMPLSGAPAAIRWRGVN